MDITPLYPPESEYWWEAIEEMLSPAMAYAAGKYNLSDLKKDVIEDKSHVWVAHDIGGIYGAAITQVAHYPQKDMLLVVCLAGKNFELWDNRLVSELVLYAKRIGCNGIEFLGRPGWVKRAAKLGFKPVHYVYELAIKDDN